MLLRGAVGEVPPADVLRLGASAFTDPRARTVWRAIRRVVERDDVPDLPTVAAALPEVGNEAVRPPVSWVAALTEACPSAGALPRYAAALRKVAQRRELARMARLVAERAEKPDVAVADLVAELRRAADAAEAEGGDAVAEAVAEATVSFDEFLGLDLPAPERWLPWLGPGSLCMTYGPRGIGKTFWCAGLAGALVTGGAFLRWEVTRPVGVLYVDGEMRPDELRARLTTMTPQPPKAPLEILSHALVYEKARRDLLLTDVRFRDAILRVLDERPEVRLVILDNLSVLFRGLREDKKDDLDSAVTPFLLALRRRGVACLLVHHAGKGGDQRGTSGREDLLDAVIRLERPGDHEAPEGARFVVRFTKARSVTGEAVAPLEARLVEGPEGALTWTWRPQEDSTLARVLRLIGDGVVVGVDIAEELGIHKSNVTRAVAKARREGLVEGTRGELRLTEKGREVAGV